MADTTRTTTADDVEILVHISAPAMSKDDVVYRALANAHLAFKPATRTSLAARDPPSSQQDPRVPEPPYHEEQAYGSFGASLDSAQLSFEGAWDNAGSPKLVSLPRGEPYHSSSPTSAQPTSSPAVEEDSWVAPPSTVQDSMPWNDLRLPELSSPSRTMEHFLGLFEDSPLSTSSGGVSPVRRGAAMPRNRVSGNIPTPVMSSPLLPPSSQRNRQDEYIEVDVDLVIPATSSDAPLMAATTDMPQSRGSDMCVTATPPLARQHILPSSEPGTEENEDSIIEDTILEDATVEETPLRPLKRHRAHHSRAGSDPLPSKRAKPSSARTLTRSSSDTGPESSSSRTSLYPLTLRNPSNAAFLSLLEIQAPGPTTSAATLTPDDLVTPNMHLLMRSFGLPRRLDLVTCHRPLRPFERGYWLLDCAGWDPGLVQRMWGFLYNYITDGFAGWGSRCVREEGWQWLRFWSFGCVAKHIYLLLHVATERTVKSAGVSWIDGAGEVVLVTKGHG